MRRASFPFLLAGGPGRGGGGAFCSVFACFSCGGGGPSNKKRHHHFEAEQKYPRPQTSPASVGPPWAPSSRNKAGGARTGEKRQNVQRGSVDPNGPSTPLISWTFKLIPLNNATFGGAKNMELREVWGMAMFINPCFCLPNGGAGICTYLSQPPHETQRTAGHKNSDWSPYQTDPLANNYVVIHSHRNPCGSRPKSAPDSVRHTDVMLCTGAGANQNDS